MRLLLIEDSETLIAQLEPELLRVAPGLQLVIARSRDSAFQHLEDDWYDVIVSDLRLPSADHQMDAEVEHGQAVWARIQEVSPGTPILVLSAFLDLGIMKTVLDGAQREDVFGSGTKHLLLNAFEKKKLPDFLRHLGGLAADVRALNDIEIATTEALTRGERRVLQVFARTNGGSLARLQLVGGGLSDARIFRITVEDARGAVTARALAKVADIPTVDDEHLRCARVTSVLPIGSCVSDLRVVRAGAGPLGGVFYPFAETHNRTLFDLLETAPSSAAEILTSLRSIEAAWQQDAPFDQQSVEKVRLRSVSESAFVEISSKLGGVGWEAFERRQVPVRLCCQHGDLHGANILVSEDGSPLLIDYGDVDDATSVLDPITLELSTVFHPDAQDLRDGWPSLEAANSWADVDAYTVGCPFPDFVKACRAWAEDCGRGPREVAATAYSVAVRQLKYDVALHPIAKAIAQSAIRSFG